MIARTIRAVPATAVLLLLMGLALPAAAQETQDTTALPEAMRAARASLSQAFSKLDGNAAAAVFAENGAVDFGDQTITGRQAVAGWFAEVFATMSSLRARSATFVVGADEIVERAGYVVVVPDGEQAGSSETVWRRQEDGSWKVSRLTVM